jgi:osmoprotectant transport system ATP-binding protein
VFRVGGKLAQYDDPGTLLARPADRFVDGFVGRDRGYRGLGFTTAEVPLGELATVELGAAAAEGWRLVVDPEGRPNGWLPGGLAAEAANVVPGGSLHDTSIGTLRSALDAALSSPSGQGVAVDGEGRVAGAVAADEVLAVLERQRTDAA